MHRSRLKGAIALLLLASLGLALALVPRSARLVSAQTSTGGTTGATIQCPTLFGQVPTPLPATLGVPPTATGTAAPSPTATGTAAPAPPIPAVLCQPVSAPVGTATGATFSVAICGTVTAYTAPTASLGGSLTVNGATIVIPAGFPALSYLSVGATAYVVFLAPGGQLIEISPGTCVTTAVPLAAHAVSGGGARRVGRTYAG